MIVIPIVHLQPTKKLNDMGILKTFFTNCAHPKGMMGRMMLRFMNFGHAPLTNWGLDLVEFQAGWTMLDIGCGGGATLKRLLKRSDWGTGLWHGHLGGKRGEGTQSECRRD